MLILTRLKQSINQIWVDEQGATLVYVALTLPVLIALAGLVMDGSNLFVQQRRMQIAADAAAMAGARAIAVGQTNSQVQGEVTSLATQNDADSVTWSQTASGKGVQVQTEHTFPTYFAGALGYETLTVTATASASYYAVTGKSELLPMTIKCPTAGFTYGAPYVLLDDAMNAPSSIGWVDWNGGASSSGELATNFSNPSLSGSWQVGDFVPAYPGTKSADGIWNAINVWVGKTISIPLWDVVSGTGSNTKYRICGFAEFQVSTASKAAKMITGTFVRTLKRGDSIGSGTDYGVRDLRFDN